jgi:16S rRNA (cytosine1402-N4)-methyltransferase
MEPDKNIAGVHVPILTKEILHNMGIVPGNVVVDATADGGGHTVAFAKAVGGTGTVISIEWDEQMVKYLQERIMREQLGSSVKVVQGNFKEIESIVAGEGFRAVDGVLFDFGFSSFHVDASGRGFTFRKDEPLDMRYSMKTQLTAREVVNTYPEKELAYILKAYGEERFARQIAEAIEVERRQRPITTTFELIAALAKGIPAAARHRKIHFATKTFQSLRIFVNDELENIRVALERSYKILGVGGLLACITFHSMEDRIVKTFGKDKEKNGLMEITTKKPIVPSRNEQKQNRRCRSAKLRIYKKIK